MSKKCKDVSICGCSSIVDFKCTVYNGKSLEPLTVLKGDNLEGVLQKINTLFEEVFVDVENAFVARNIGSGIEILRGARADGVQEFKTLKSGSGIKLSENEGSIVLTLDEDYFGGNGSPTTAANISSIGKGVPILKQLGITSPSYKVKTLSSSDNTVSIKEDLDGGIDLAVSKSIISSVQNVGPGVSILKNSNGKLEAKNLSSDGSIDIITNEAGGAYFAISKESSTSIANYNISTNLSSIKLDSDGLPLVKNLFIKVLDRTGTELPSSQFGKLYLTTSSNTTPKEILRGDFVNLQTYVDTEFINIYYVPINTNTVVDLKTIPYVRDGKEGKAGANGANGANGINGTNGTSLFSIELSNDNASISATYEGTIVDISNAVTNYQLYTGGTKMTQSDLIEYKFEVLDPSQKLLYTFDPYDNQLEIVDMVGESNGIIISAYLVGRLVATAIFTVTMVRGGEPGVPGTITYLETSSRGINVTATGVIVPKQFYVKAFDKKGAEPPREITQNVSIKYRTVNYAGGLGGVFSYIIGQPINLNDLITKDIASIQFTLQKNGVQVDNELVNITRDGINGIAGISPYLLDLSNDNASLSALWDGTVVDYSTAYTTYKLMLGATEVLATPSNRLEFTFTPVNVDRVIDMRQESGNTISVRDVEEDSNGIIISAKIAGQVVASATFTVTKVRGGADGQPGIVRYLLPSSTQITVSNDGVVVPGFINVKSMYKKGADSVVEDSSGVTLLYTVTNGKVESEYKTYVSGRDIIVSDQVTSNTVKFTFYLFSGNTNLDKEDISVVRNGKDGPIAGYTQEFRYQKNGSFTVAPALNKSEVNPQGWTISPPNTTVSEVLWSTSAAKRNSDGTLVAEWATPIRITGPMGPAGTNGGNASKVFIAPMGKWDSTRSYTGSSKRVEAVIYNGTWFVTTETAGTIPAGSIPAVNSFWNISDINYDFIATGLFLAQTAWIDNLGVNNLKTAIPNYDSNGNQTTNPKRVEITGSKNSIEFFTGNEPIGNDASITINTNGGGGISGDENDDTYFNGSHGITIKSNDRVKTSFLTTEGIFSNAGSYKFSSASSGYASSSSIIGLVLGKDQNFDYMARFDVGIAGISHASAHQSRFGKQAGGYFNSLFMGGQYLVQDNRRYTATYTARYNNVTYNAKNTVVSPNSAVVVSYENAEYDWADVIFLPKFAKLSEGWNPDAVWKVTIIKTFKGRMILNVGDGRTLVISNGSTGVPRDYDYEVKYERSRFDLYWDGSNWQLFGIA